jgi:homoserine O-acetyltransferase/O-succinyltransferase
MKLTTLLVTVFCLITATASAATYATPREGTWELHDFRFHTGKVLPILKLHYRTVGESTGEPVLILHGTGGSGAAFLVDSFAGELFGAGKPLDASRYFIIIPDGIGHGGSSKPSDGLRTRFPRYDFDDMVRAQYRLLTEHLGVRHLRLIIGGSIGGMQAWLWGERYPGFVDALMPLQCLPVEIAGLNRMLRRVILDGIRSDPDWKNGQYQTEPLRALTIAQYGAMALFGAPLRVWRAAPTRALADAAFDKLIANAVAGKDANDMLYQYEASTDFDPAADLGKIQARVIAINTEDDTVNQPELGVMEREIRKVPRGRYVLVPRGDSTIGHGSYTVGMLFAQYIVELLQAQ